METMNIEDILALLPHRYPFAMIDRIVELDIEGRRIVGIKNVTINEPYFQGHFPVRRVMPGVMQLEAMAQTGGVLLLKTINKPGVIPYFMSADKCKFRKVVIPGDQLRLEAEVTAFRATVARVKARAYVDGEVVSEAELACALADTQAG